MNISQNAVAAREAARSKTGEFGHQQHTESGVRLGGDATPSQIQTHVRQAISQIEDTTITWEDPRLTQDGELDADEVQEVLAAMRDEGLLMARASYGSYRIPKTPRPPMPGTALTGPASAEQLVGQNLQTGRRVSLQVYQTKSGDESKNAITLGGYVSSSYGSVAELTLDEGQEWAGDIELELNLNTEAVFVRGLSVEDDGAIWLDAADPNDSDETPFGMRITTPDTLPTQGPTGQRGPWVREDGAESPFDLTPIKPVYRDPRGQEYFALVPGAEVSYRRIVTDPTGNPVGHIETCNGGQSWTAAMGIDREGGDLAEDLDELSAALWVHHHSEIGGGWSVPKVEQGPLF